MRRNRNTQARDAAAAYHKDAELGHTGLSLESCLQRLCLLWQNRFFTSSIVKSEIT